MRFEFRPAVAAHPLNRVRHEMDRLVGDFFGPWAAAVDRGLSAVAGYPSLNVWEEAEALYAEAEVPGLKAEDLEISVVGDQLVLKGKRAAALGEATFHRRERGVGEFTRSLTLPVAVDADQVEASLNDGVLRIKLPKAEAAKPRKINIVRG